MVIIQSVCAYCWLFHITFSDVTSLNFSSFLNTRSQRFHLATASDFSSLAQIARNACFNLVYPVFYPNKNTNEGVKKAIRLCICSDLDHYSLSLPSKQQASSVQYCRGAQSYLIAYSIALSIHVGLLQQCLNREPMEDRVAVVAACSVTPDNCSKETAQSSATEAS